MKATIALLLLLLSTSAFAQGGGGGGSAGNGGGGGTGGKGGQNAALFFKTEKEAQDFKERYARDGIIRDDDLAQVERIEAFDLFYAKKPIRDGREPVLDLARTGEKCDDWVSRVTDRWRGLVPHVANVIQEGMQALGPSRRFSPYILRINDAEPIEDCGSGCALATIAAQRYSIRGDAASSVLSLDERLFVEERDAVDPGKKPFLRLHSHESQCFTYLHEYALRWSMLVDQQGGSIDAREFVRILTTLNLGKSMAETVTELNSLGFGGQLTIRDTAAYIAVSRRLKARTQVIANNWWNLAQTRSVSQDSGEGRLILMSLLSNAAEETWLIPGIQGLSRAASQSIAREIALYLRLLALRASAVSAEELAELRAELDEPRPALEQVLKTVGYSIDQ